VPIGGPIPLHRYRKSKKTKIEKRLERLEALAEVLVLGEPEGDGREALSLNEPAADLPSRPFQDPDPFHEICFANGIKARLAIADYLGKPLALLAQAQKDWIDNLLDETLEKQQVMQRVRAYFRPHRDREGSHVT